MKYVAYTFAFLAEIVAWCSVASLGFRAGGGRVRRWVLTVVLFAVVTALWGAFMSPNAPHRLAIVPFYVVKAVLYGAAAVVLWQYDRRWSIAFLAMLLLSEPFLIRDERELR